MDAHLAIQVNMFGRDYLPMKITRKQFDLLTYVLIASYRAHVYDRSTSYLPRKYSITWSPKNFLGRSPTKAEAATLSKRMTELVRKDLILREGRQIAIQPAATVLMQQYLITSDEVSNFHQIYSLLSIIRINELAATIQRAVDAIRIYDQDGEEGFMTESTDEGNELRLNLNELYATLLERLGVAVDSIGAI